MAMIPVLVKGQMSEMDESLLQRKDVYSDNDNETVNAVEYWLDGELVHRSAHIQLKKSVFSITDVGSFA